MKYSAQVRNPSSYNVSQTDGFCAALDFAVATDEIFDIYNNAPCGYHSLDSFGFFTRINNTELRWLGYTRDELIGKRRFCDFVAPNTTLVQSESDTSDKYVSGSRTYECRLLRKNDSSIDVSVSEDLIYNRSGAIVGCRSNVFDITERKQKDQARVERERFMNRVISTAPDFMYVYDFPSQRIVFANREIAPSIGFATDPMNNLDEDFFERIVRPEELTRLAEHRARILSLTDNTTIEWGFQVLCRDGTARFFRSRDTVFSRDAQSGMVTQYIGSIQDLSERHDHDIVIRDNTGNCQ